MWVLKSVTLGDHNWMGKIEDLPLSIVAVDFGCYEELKEKADRLEIMERDVNGYFYYELMTLEDYRENLVKQGRLALQKRSELIKDLIKDVNKLKLVYEL